MSYTAPVPDITFALNEIAGMREAIADGLFGDLSEDLAQAVLEEAGRFAASEIAPLQRILDADVPVHLGIDNMHDLFMPIVDGDMWTECRMLMEAMRFYDIEKVMAIGCDRSGFGL